ncbi:MAG: nucleotidyltransferase family protein [bacterium]|nr:nucleotidyltransferase family protein [bacterium]
MKKSKDILNLLTEHKKEMINKFKIKKLALFGSFIREEQDINSDIDILIEFKEGFKTFDNYMDLKFYLEDLLDIRVDLVLKSALKERLKNVIISEAIYV